MMRTQRFLVAFAIAAFTALSASAQVTTGTPPFGSFGGGPDVINLANLNSHITIPVLHKAGRGTDFTYDLSYDTSVWAPVSSSGSSVWTPVPNWGWRGQTEAATGYISYNSGLYYPEDCTVETVYDNFVYHDNLGLPHNFGGSISNHGCDFPTSQTLGPDESGLKLAVSVTYAGVVSAPLTSSAGAIVKPPLLTSTGAANFTDRNGNQLTVDNSGHFYDTLSGTTATLTVAGSGTPSSPATFTYTAPSTASAAYSMKYTAYTVQTKFGCSATDYGPTSNNLVSEIDLPDVAVNPNDKYTFTYETTPGGAHNPHYVTGRLASVTLPTGGTITYVYTGGSSGNITCADGSTSGLERYTPDTGSNYWNYARTPGTGAAYTTTITDPSTAANVTVVQFQGLYETQRDSYQGAISSSNLLQTIKTCYNNHLTNCTTTAVALPISQRNVYHVLPSGQQSEHDDFWNAYAAPTETDDYDYGTAPHGTLLKKTLASYVALGYINAFRQSVSVQNGTGITVSKINYNYDETAVTSTSGTPQHTTPPSSRGNLTSMNIYTSSSTYLIENSTFYDTGNINTSTDTNGGVTTVNYASGLASCYNSFPTSTTEAVTTLSTSQTWNCTGGVQLTSADENNQTITTSYTDLYFWRPASVTDRAGATTNYCYGVITGGTCTVTTTTQVESTLNFNSNSSTVDSLMTVDSLGRTHVEQTRQGPASSISTFDSVETDYDALGRPARVTLPYSGTAGQTNSSVAATTTTYDALSRALTISDGGGGSIVYYYGPPGSQNNDTLITSNPPPAWDSENAKRHQFEYDGLGRLTSTCEVTVGTTAWPGGSCSQNSPQTGYLTKYTYDPLGNITGLTQNAQMSGSTQTRSYVYDWKSRRTSETVPEIGVAGNGTATFTYDSDTTCGTSGGDLVKRIDAVGDVICLTYDALHRQLTMAYPSGTYASVSPQKHFVYDGATVNGQVMAYPKARLAEAYTCFSPCTTKLTDIGLSYTLRGETSDVYESTPNSGTYYHLTQSYWANGLPDQLGTNLAGVPALTYSPDGEGRVSAVSASSGQSPLVSSTNYSTASLPTAINLGSGSGDTDSYSYDPNTNRMSQYQFTVNGTSLTAPLGWNANGTLQTQNITDGFNSSDAQNCSYQYDDVSRVTGASCGSAAAQTFSYDPFGNINKQGSPYSFNAFYSASTNRITCVGGSGLSCTGGVIPTYDNNGNITRDSLHNYTWDADGHPITVDTGLSDAVTITFDALGRMVEQNRGGTYTQIAYSTGGYKFALMSGSALQKAMVPLSGQALAVYNSSGLLYYGHPDLLGSVRLATTPARTMYFDTAYAPFGETYAYSGSVDPAYTGQMNDTAHRQDVAGGLYDFPAREYSVQGRWPSPDPAGISSTCPKDPQTQNRYAYVRNNPITYTDPSGMDGACEDDPFCWDPCPWWDPWVCLGGGGGTGGGGGGNPENRPFPWPSLPLGFFTSGSGANQTPPHLGCRGIYEQCLDAAHAVFQTCNGEALNIAGHCATDCYEKCPGSENRFDNPLSALGRGCFRKCLAQCVDQLEKRESDCAAALNRRLRICNIANLFCGLFFESSRRGPF